MIDRHSRIKFSRSKLDQSLSRIFDLVEGWFEKMSGVIRKCGRGSDIVAVRLSNIGLGIITFELILSIRAIELFLTLVGYVIWGRSIHKESEWINSFLDGCWLSFNKSILKSPRKESVLFFFDNICSKLLR